jgi:hypothetical protein
MLYVAWAAIHQPKEQSAGHLYHCCVGFTVIIIDNPYLQFKQTKFPQLMNLVSITSQVPWRRSAPFTRQVREWMSYRFPQKWNEYKEFAAWTVRSPDLNSVDCFAWKFSESMCSPHRWSPTILSGCIQYKTWVVHLWHWNKCRQYLYVLKRAA